MNLFRNLCLAAVMAMVFLLASCQSQKISQYVAPRITGRVLDGQSQQPLANVQIRKVSGQQRWTADDSMSAGQAMQRNVERTAGDGTFELASQRDLAFLRKTGWYSVTLSFSRNGYQDLSVTYSLTNSTQTVSGEPWIQTGDVLLFPVKKSKETQNEN